jgi:hypothetical protein
MTQNQASEWTFMTGTLTFVSRGYRIYIVLFWKVIGDRQKCKMTWYCSSLVTVMTIEK